MSLKRTTHNSDQNLLGDLNSSPPKKPCKAKGEDFGSLTAAVESERELCNVSPTIRCKDDPSTVHRTTAAEDSDKDEDANKEMDESSHYNVTRGCEGSERGRGRGRGRGREGGGGLKGRFINFIERKDPPHRGLKVSRQFRRLLHTELVTSILVHTL